MSRYINHNFSGNRYTRIFDPTSHETIDILGAKIKRIEDFAGAAVDTNLWTEVEANNATKATALGLNTYSFTNTDQVQDAGIYGSDIRWNIDKGVIFEARLRVSTLPTLLTELLIGLQNDGFVSDSNRVAGADEVDRHMFMALIGSGALVIYTDDHSVDHDAVATGITIGTTDYYVFRIDATDSSKVRFFVNGARVAASTTFKLNTTANMLVMPLICAVKHSGGGLGVFVLDYIKIWQLER